MQNLNGTGGSVSIIGAVSNRVVTSPSLLHRIQSVSVRCFWGLDKPLAYARHFPGYPLAYCYSEYLEDLTPWYRDNVSAKFVSDRNQLMAILNQESSDGIVKLIGSDVLPMTRSWTLEIARVIRLGFLPAECVPCRGYLCTDEQAVQWERSSFICTRSAAPL